MDGWPNRLCPVGTLRSLVPSGQQTVGPVHEFDSTSASARTRFADTVTNSEVPWGKFDEESGATTLEHEHDDDYD